MTEHEPTTPERAWRWPLFLVGLLAMCVLTQTVLIVVAVSDPRQHVEPDYYQKGLAWDAHVAEAQASAALGWTIACSLDAVPGGARILNVDARDASGAPLAGAEVTCEARHRADLDHPLESTLSETEPGRYAGAFAMRRVGVWELSLTVVRGGERFVSSQVVDTRSDRP
ncbi:MAG: FixH family protein [Planctomycetota bacterium]